MFKHFADTILVGTLEYPLAEFLIDEPGYPGLPEGAIARVYDPDRSVNALHLGPITARTQVDGGDFAALGDRYLSREAAYRAAYTQRIAQRKADAEAAKRPAEILEERLRVTYEEKFGHTMKAVVQLVEKMARGTPLTATDRTLANQLRSMDETPDLDSIPANL